MSEVPTADPKPRRSAKTAWSVVIGISAICGLGGMVAYAALFASIQRTTTSFHKTACLSSLKESGLSLLMYAGDNNDLLPQKGAPWMDLINPYIKGRASTGCEAVRSTERQGFGLAANTYALGEHVSAFANPSNAAMAFDSTNLAKNAVSGYETLTKPGRHAGFNNFSLLDGHVKSIKDGSPSPNEHPAMRLP